MKKNQERRLHRKNAKIVKEGGTPMQLNRPVKPDTTVSSIFSPPMVGCLFSMYSFQRRCGHCGQMGHMSRCIYHISFQLLLTYYILHQKPTANVHGGQNSIRVPRRYPHLPLRARLQRRPRVQDLLVLALDPTACSRRVPRVPCAPVLRSGSRVHMVPPRSQQARRWSRWTKTRTTCLRHLQGRPN